MKGFESAYRRSNVTSLAWVLAYAIDAGVTRVMPCIRAFPERVALASFSTELGDVKINLYAFVFIPEISIRGGIFSTVGSHKLKWCFGTNRPKDVLLNKPGLCIEELATDLPKLIGFHCEDGPWFWNRLNFSGNKYFNITDWLSDQSTPAGHSKAPVVWWWNPRSSLTFRWIGGLSDWPRGTIQSRIALLRLFVSSDLAWEAPFWTF